MSSALFLMSTEADSGKSALALALFEAMARRVPRPAVFRPVTRDGDRDFIVDLLLSRLPEGNRPAASDCVGVTYEQNHADPHAARATVVARFRDLASRHDAVLVVGSDFTDVGAASELATNIDIAQDLAAPVVAVVTGRDRDGVRPVEAVRAAAEHALDSLLARNTPVIGLVANRCDPDGLETLRDAATDVAQQRGLDVPVAVVPELALLAAPTLRQISDAVGARLLSGSDDDLDRAAVDVMVAAMTLPHMLERLVEQAVVIVPGDRADVLVGTLAAAHADTFPTPAGLLLTGGFAPDPVTARLLAGFSPSPPVVLAQGATFEVATVAAGLRGRMRAGSSRKIEAALQLASEHVPAEAWLDRLALSPTDIVTPVMFTHDLFERARADRRRVVLPEGTDPRVLRAAARVLRGGIADVTLLGDVDAVASAAAAAGADIAAAEVVDPATDERRERYADVYAELRAHRGVSRAVAHDTVADVSYFGTLMVHLDEADGMVSGAVHTTAHTIRPAFEIIRTREGVSVVSSVFFMLLPDKVLVYGDCAVVPSPDAQQLADIAIRSAETAESFGVQPRVAMLSYSTGESGTGADVERVREATALVRERRPDLLVEGPLQYDAAVDPAVAASKLPGSEVAGRATVLVFPDLNTGNNTYKAVQRSAGATAVGPVLQGLNKPVNDLSRGATVDDIATTVAVTAVQAQERAGIGEARGSGGGAR